MTFLENGEVVIENYTGDEASDVECVVPDTYSGFAGAGGTVGTGSHPSATTAATQQAPDEFQQCTADELRGDGHVLKPEAPDASELLGLRSLRSQLHSWVAWWAAPSCHAPRGQTSASRS